jgi:hypothetical protein
VPVADSLDDEGGGDGDVFCSDLYKPLRVLIGRAHPGSVRRALELLLRLSDASNGALCR